jgi:hypothetical protein
VNVTSTSAPARSLPRPALLPLVAAALVSTVVSACGGPAASASFALALHNGSDTSVRLNVVVTSGQRPPNSLRVPARSGVLETSTQPMTSTSGKVDPVVIEIYTETCALLTKVTVGAGTTLVSIGSDLAVTTSPTSLTGGTGALAPETAPPC